VHLVVPHVCVEAPLHLLTSFASLLHLMPLYASKGDLRLREVALIQKRFGVRQCHFMLQPGGILCFKAQRLGHQIEVVPEFDEVFRAVRREIRQARFPA
jgi:hypothetical protein